MNVGVLLARADGTTDIRDLSHLPSSSNFSQFFNNWRLNSEKIEGIESNSYSSTESENRQKLKEIQSKLTALQNLYDDRNWEPIEHEHFITHAERNARQLSGKNFIFLLGKKKIMQKNQFPNSGDKFLCQKRNNSNWKFLNQDLKFIFLYWGHFLEFHGQFWWPLGCALKWIMNSNWIDKILHSFTTKKTMYERF